MAAKPQPCPSSRTYTVPTQKELEQHARSHCFTAVTMAPHKLASAMSPGTAFELVWDSGASHCITNNEKDFEDGTLEQPNWMVRTLQGLAKGLRVKGVGTVSWTVLDTDGNPRTLRLPAYFVPESPARLLSLPQLLQTYPGETVQITNQMAVLSGLANDDTRTQVQAHFNPTNNLPTTPAYHLNEMQRVSDEFNAMVAVVDPRNQNLSAAEKELLKHHQKLAHLDLRRVQFLLRTGVLATSAAQKALHTQASKIRDPPKCAACQFGKQTVRVPKTKTTTTVIKDALPVIPQTHSKLPGQTVSIDHFVCSQKGVTLTSRGGIHAPGYTGGSLLHDNASGFIHVEFHKHLNTHETLEGLRNFEALALDYGVVPTSYVSDSGSAFTAKEFKAHLQQFHQIVKFAGTSAHHHNPYAERSIRTIMSMARTMMLHAAAYWTEMADATLWPLAVQYAVHIYNRVPNPETGLSPLDVFSGSRQPQRHLRDLHVWGCPAYTLNKDLADGKKIKRWAARSVRSIFVGISGAHLSSTPQVLNTTTRAITTPYHVVFDDWFHTVGSDPDSLPDFNTPEWAEMFGDSVYQYMPDSNWPHLGASPYQDIPSRDPADPIFNRREQVLERMNQQYHPDPIQPLSGQTFPPVSVPSIPFPENFAQRETAQTLPRTVTQDKPVSQETTHSVSNAPNQAALQNPTSSIDLQPAEQPLEQSEQTTDQSWVEVPLRRSSRVRTAPPKLTYDKLGNSSDNIHSNLAMSASWVYHTLGETMSPDIYKAANSDPDTMTLDQALAQSENRDKWIEALEKEVRSLEDRGCWKEVPISAARGDIVPVHWVMKIKRKPDGSMDKFKARLVVRGDMMKNYDFETFAPTCAWSTIRMILILTIAWSWITCTCDYTNAFTMAHLDNPIWIRLPRGYRSEQFGQTCLELLRSLYGTTFAPKLWCDCLFAALKEYGLVQSKFDPCMFCKPGMMACVYVDDLILAFKHAYEKEKFFQFMKDKYFDLTIGDTLDAFLGIKFEALPQDKGFNLTQPALIQKIIDATGMNTSNPSPTPTTPNQPLAKDPEGEPMDERWSYPSIIGMLLYLSNNSRPDLVFAVSQVARFTHDPKQSHAAAVKRIVRYLVGTADKGTIIKPDGTLALTSYSDSDFAGLFKVDPENSVTSAQSRMGYIIKLGGCMLVCKSQLISSICLATAEAEYYSLSHCLRALIPIKRTLEELTTNLGLSLELRATIRARALGDNTAAITLARTHRLTSRTRYYHTAAHHFWQYVDDPEFGLEIGHIDTKKMDADFLTKSMPREPFSGNRFRVQGW
jgi:Reverse transcriptase (RNA-dependent DNA polymerase)